MFDLLLLPLPTDLSAALYSRQKDETRFFTSTCLSSFNADSEMTQGLNAKGVDSDVYWSLPLIHFLAFYEGDLSLLCACIDWS